MEGIITLLIFLMIIAAIISLEIKDLLSSVVSLGAVGLILTLLFLLLQAPDVAIVQFVVEILSLVILIRATVVRDETIYNKKSFFLRLPIIFFVFVFLTIVGFSFKDLPSFGKPKYKLAEYYVNNTIKDTGAVDVVSAIILNYRAYDTLGEVVVLFTAILGAVLILRKIGKSNEKE
ncbi:MAG: hydrogen gas-evolving membrane-bound hydrogenase subunit E [Endomicrobiia bacterium]